MKNNLMPIKDFLKYDSSLFITELIDSNPSASKSQIQSWIALVDDLKKSNIKILPNDAVISIEFNLPVDGMAIDLMIFGVDRQGVKNAFLVEAKQWVDANVFEYNFGEYRSETLTLHPQIQVSRHAMGFKDYTNIGYDYLVHPFVYSNNLTKNGIEQLINSNPRNELKKVPITNSLDDIFNQISNTIVAGMDGLVTSISTLSYKPSKSIISAMESMVTKYDPFILTGEQEKVVEKIFKSLEEGKKIIRITGAAGSGKTAILLHTYINLLNKQSDDIRPIFISGAQNTKLYQSLFREVERSFSFSFSLDRMVGKTIGHKYYICMDEAQHNESGIITNMINRNAHLILCYDEGQTINANNALTELKQLKNRSDFVSIELQNSVRFSGSQIFETNVKKVLNGDMQIIPDSLYDFRVFETIEELENHTIELIKSKPESSVAVTGLLSKNANEIANRTNSQIFIEWGNAGETRWIPYIEGKNYLNQNNGKLWVGTWWLPGLDVDYISVIIGNDAKFTVNGLEVDTDGVMQYKMMYSIVDKLGCPKSLYVYKKMFGKEVIDNKATTSNIYKHMNQNIEIKEKFINEFTQLIKNNYYILLTRGRKGCYVCFSNK